MTDQGDPTPQGSPASPEVEVPGDILSAARASVRASVRAHGAPPVKPVWLDRFVWTVLWKIAAVALAVTVMLMIYSRAQNLIGMLVISIFFALAIIPAVNRLHLRFGMRRGAAVGVVYAGAVAFVVIMVVVLIPAIVQLAQEIRTKGGEWIASFNAWTLDTFGREVISVSGGADAADTAGSALEGWGDEILGFAVSGIGLVFNFFTIAMFTFYFAADFPRIERALMSRMPPKRQKVWGWISDVSIEQTGGYFYSRALLMVINGGLAFVVMLLIGLPAVFAFPLAVFMGFVSEFIPAIGTYIGGAIPILVTLAMQGLVAGIVLLVWVLIYQQIENYYLSPKLSAQTMELNGAIAFGSALAGGAIAGPMGAFMALPVAAMITAVIKNTGKTYDVVYELKYDTTGKIAAPAVEEVPAEGAPAE